ncbi:HTTM domain-containing protein [Natrarchaeobaculum sulfurireducens]|uniref:HTTM-like domain-containing protein n=1 Tax=Natrarchaeobaculum sulfurireducens TaxID=2044521 RepID=A0A346PKK1_9EURY|nr:HTTM domain-containing protein [Natrarchaeobaculum sulfurireducens]AXR80046.1 hypothetical protein AArcMg_0012 [Natrarchaeobaculum sulfurireducens]
MRDERSSRPKTNRSPKGRTRLESVKSAVRSRFEVDTRALAALRIGLGSILLLDVIHRAGDIETYYTDAGAYPLEAYEATYPQFNGLSIHALSGELWVQQLLFLVAGVFAVALIVGYRTRLVAAISLVLLLSLHARNPAVLNGGDRLLRVMLLLALVTPIGERWSVDALRRGSTRPVVASFATAALLVQPVVVFTQNAILKHRGDTWYSGDGVKIALANDVMTIHLGNHLGAYPALLEVLNWVWVILLAGSGGFLLVTSGRLRALFALAYIGAFVGLLTSVAVGLFPLVLIATMIPFLTTPFWETLARFVPSRLTDRLPSASALGPLSRPPVERRALESARTRGYERVTSVAETHGRSLLTAVGVLLLCWILLFSAINVVDHDGSGGIETEFSNEQHWGLYAPDPSTSYSWFGAEATLENGSTVDAFEGGELAMERPVDASQEYDTFRERKFLEAVRDSGREGTNNVTAESYADWVCDRADDEHDADVDEVRLFRLVQASPVDGEYEDLRAQTVIERAC